MESLTLKKDTVVIRSQPSLIKGVVKIRLSGPSASNTETVWAIPLHGDLYKLDNSPFFAYGLSWEDVVEAKLADDNVLEFVRCVEKSGNRTLRIIFQDYKGSDPDADEILRELKNLGCSYEGMQPRMVSVTVPPATELNAVTDFLMKQNGLHWEYADPTYDQVTHRIN